MKSDEIWWNLMKSDEIWWILMKSWFHQITSNLIFSFFFPPPIFFSFTFFCHPDQSITKCVLRKQMVHQKHFRVTHFGFQSFSSRAHCWFQHPFIKGYAKKCLSMQWVVFVFEHESRGLVFVETNLVIYVIVINWCWKMGTQYTTWHFSKQHVYKTIFSPIQKGEPPPKKSSSRGAVLRWEALLKGKVNVCCVKIFRLKL